MPTPKDKRDYKHETALEKKRPGAFADRMERQRARRELDKKGVDRTGKEVSHKKALSRGGTNKDGYFLDSKKNNGTFARTKNHKPKSLYDTKG